MVPLTLATTLAFILAVTALASSDASSSKTHLSPLLKRQSDAFVPDKTDGNGETCADAFGPGYYSCGTGIECVNPAKGQTCCSGGYGCPRNSFCLIEGYCCPDGVSPESCAGSNFVTLPADFTTAGVTLSNSTSPSTSVSLSAVVSTSRSTRASTSSSTSVRVRTSTSSVVAVVPTSAESTSTESTSAESTAAVAANTASTSTTQTATTTRPSVGVSTGAARAWRAVGAGEGGFGVLGLAGLVGVLGVVGGVM